MVSHQKIKDLFELAVEHICSDISNYSLHPDIDFQSNRKISSQKLISFLVSQGSSSTKVEMLDFWGLDASSMPTSSALNQQRQKLKPAALEAVFKHFNSSVMGLLPSTLSDGKYRFLAADGSTCTYFSTPSFSSDDYYYSPGNSIRGVYSMHLNAFYDLTTHTYTDALIQPVHCKNMEIVTILEKNEYSKLLAFLQQADPAAFVTVSTVNEVIGEWNRKKSVLG